jgi:DNA processing protein
MSSSDLVYWLALQEKHWFVPARKVEQVFNQFGSLEQLWKADTFSLRDLGLSETLVSAFLRYRNSVRLDDYERLIGVLTRNKVKLLRYVDKNYPAALKDLGRSPDGPPLVLFYKGSLQDFNDCVAIVGTRELSLHGHIMARKLAKTIAKSGYNVVSGLARGTDTEAHCGALEAPRGRTIAVLAWMDPIYPPENVELAKDIMSKGGLLSELYFRPGSKFGKLTPGKFVERNRITSGLSRCVIAVESGKEGGTVHQVRIALSQGRKVFALKPKAQNLRAKEGFKVFLDMGATPINSAKPVLDFLRKPKAQKALEERRIDSFSQRSITTFGKGD